MSDPLSTTAPSSKHIQSAFLEWNEEPIESTPDKLSLFHSLVQMINDSHYIDGVLEEKVVPFLEQIRPEYGEEVDRFLLGLTPTDDESLQTFVNSIIVLVSSPKQAIVTATMRMLDYLQHNASPPIHLKLVHAALIPRLLSSLNPLSLSFVDGAELHTLLISLIFQSLWLSTPNGLQKLEIKDSAEQQTVHETVLDQVLVPSKGYVQHLCENRLVVIADSSLSDVFVSLLVHLLHISLSHPPTSRVVLALPAILAIPSSFTSNDTNFSSWRLLSGLANAQKRWVCRAGLLRQSEATPIRSLRMEGWEDVVEQQMQHTIDGDWARVVGLSARRMSGVDGANILQVG
ncbi:hypothetical protein BLNAU_19325 [Blattamonas nauphoetae]|uniref:Uncharacterized protein n=1 Tax=Blattamonas nauphoetae TaxID=2049346 RepID=A0ABQ9X1Y7_9EUKA|nr:hypothetical protein BLNAU_19325 [Blattamonas nauphoetae]